MNVTNGEIYRVTGTWDDSSSYDWVVVKGELVMVDSGVSKSPEVFSHMFALSQVEKIRGV